MRRCGPQNPSFRLPARAVIALLALGLVAGCSPTPDSGTPSDLIVIPPTAPISTDSAGAPTAAAPHLIVTALSVTSEIWGPRPLPTDGPIRVDGFDFPASGLVLTQCGPDVEVGDPMSEVCDTSAQMTITDVDDGNFFGVDFDVAAEYTVGAAQHLECVEAHCSVAVGDAASLTVLARVLIQVLVPVDGT